MRLIDADALIRKIEEHREDGTIANYVRRVLAATLDKEPTVDAAPVPHGYIQDSDVGPICSVCGVPIRLDHETPDWCPRCGAALDGGDEDA